MTIWLSRDSDGDYAVHSEEPEAYRFIPTTAICQYVRVWKSTHCLPVVTAEREWIADVWSVPIDKGECVSVSAKGDGHYDYDPVAGVAMVTLGHTYLEVDGDACEDQDLEWLMSECRR